MKVSKLINILKKMPQDVDVTGNDEGVGEVYSIDCVHHYIPNTDLWPDDVQEVVVTVNEQ